MCRSCLSKDRVASAMTSTSKCRSKQPRKCANFARSKSHSCAKLESNAKGCGMTVMLPCQVLLERFEKPKRGKLCRPSSIDCACRTRSKSTNKFEYTPNAASLSTASSGAGAAYRTRKQSNEKPSPWLPSAATLSIRCRAQSCLAALRCVVGSLASRAAQSRLSARVAFKSITTESREEPRAVCLRTWSKSRQVNGEATSSRSRKTTRRSAARCASKPRLGSKRTCVKKGLVTA
mmetsp:Transcript_45285/g.84955  ORF Transcript_45285/g.84955 Transcript_45285/m.84955 type:complete len:234 (-) Transcript_45285:258-959(-)